MTPSTSSLLVQAQEALHCAEKALSAVARATTDRPFLTMILPPDQGALDLVTKNAAAVITGHRDLTEQFLESRRDQLEDEYLLNELSDIELDIGNLLRKCYLQHDRLRASRHAMLALGIEGLIEATGKWLAQWSQMRQVVRARRHSAS